MHSTEQTGGEITLTKVAAPALRLCAGIQYCDCSVHTGSPPKGIRGCVNGDEGQWGGSTVWRGGLRSAERPVACTFSSSPGHSLQIGQAVLQGSRPTLDANSHGQGIASRVQSHGSRVAVCAALLNCDAGLPIQDNAGPLGWGRAWRLCCGWGCSGRVTSCSV